MMFSAEPDYLFFEFVVDVVTFNVLIGSTQEAVSAFEFPRPNGILDISLCADFMRIQLRMLFIVISINNGIFSNLTTFYGAWNTSRIMAVVLDFIFPKFRNLFFLSTPGTLLHISTKTQQAYGLLGRNRTLTGSWSQGLVPRF